MSTWVHGCLGLRPCVEKLMIVLLCVFACLSRAHLTDSASVTVVMVTSLVCTICGGPFNCLLHETQVSKTINHCFCFNRAKYAYPDPVVTFIIGGTIVMMRLNDHMTA